jgi:hypothetical protein
MKKITWFILGAIVPIGLVFIASLILEFVELSYYDIVSNLIIFIIILGITITLVVRFRKVNRDFVTGLVSALVAIVSLYVLSIYVREKLSKKWKDGSGSFSIHRPYNGTLIDINR